MSGFDKKAHWESIYASKKLVEVSWYQPTPATSLEIISAFNLPKTAKIIDVGGGDSLLIDHLLDLGYQDITVLDISQRAIGRAQQRLGAQAAKVTWIVADAADFHPESQYDLWHDRAAFHFLTAEEDIHNYLETLQKHLRPGGHLVIGTFSENGPEKCSGIPIRQYSEENMSKLFSSHFEKIRCFTLDHPTPSGNIQNFLFCTFIRH